MTVEAAPMVASGGTRLPLLALTLHRPWCWAILCAGKDVENRSWRPPAHLVGQFLAIHSGKIWDEEAALWLLAHGYPVPRQEEWPSGEIRGLVRVQGFGRDVVSPWYSPGKWGWQLADPLLFRTAVPHIGSRGLWRVEQVEPLARIRGEVRRLREGHGHA